MAAAPTETPIRTGARLPWEAQMPEDARVLSNAAESLAAAALVVDLVIHDLHAIAGEDPKTGTLLAIRELFEVRTSLSDLAAKARGAARRHGAPA